MVIIRIKVKIVCILKKMFFKLIYGKKISFSKKFYFRKNFNVTIDNDGNLKIGNDCFFNNGCSINCLGNIVIGENCIFGESVKLYDHNHKFSNKDINIKDQGYKVGKISIGNNCWIGSNVIILKDVTIGDNVVIGANSLIYKSIPSNSVVKSRTELIIEELK